MGQDNGYYRRDFRTDNNHGVQGKVLVTRPSSWHPGSRGFDTCSENIPANDSIWRYPTTETQALAVNGATFSQDEIPSVHQDYIMDGSSTLYQQPSIAVDNCGIYGGDPYPSYPTYDLSDQTQYTSDSLPYTYGTYTPEDFQERYWSQLSSNFANFVPQQTTEFLSMHYPTEIPDVASFEQSPQINKKRSKELVGMGLYDDPEKDISSNLDHIHSSSLSHHRESTGKGLKLEETWQPPKDPNDVEDDGEEEEAYSTDEAEEDLPVAPVPEEVQPVFYPSYGDLSNQSFFFDNDDQYSSCIAFDQEIQACQPKGSDSASENFLWF